MSPIFNQSALTGLSNHALKRLRAVLQETLRTSRFTKSERQSLNAALKRVEAILAQRLKMIFSVPSGPGF